MSTVYLIRCQGVGVIPDKVYLRPPTLEEMKAWLVYEIERWGIDKDGKARIRWVQCQEAEVAGDDSFKGVPFDETKHTRRVEGMLDEVTIARILKEKSESPDYRASGAGGVPLMVVHGSGAVTNPGDPGYVPDTGEKAVRMMRQAETERRVQAELAAKEATDRETMSLTSADVGTLDLDSDVGK